MCKYTRLACMLDIIMCSGVNTVVIIIMLRAIMGELNVCATEVHPHYQANVIHLCLL